MLLKDSTPLVLSVTIHVGLAVVLLWGDFSTPPKPTPSAVQIEPIQAVIVEKSTIDAQINKIKKQEADKVRKRKELEESIAAAKRKKLNEEKRIKTLERERKKKAQEKKAADIAAKKAKANAADKLRKQKELERQQADKAASDARAKRLKEEVAAKKAEDLRKKKAAERKRKELEARERAAQQKLLAEQMAEDMANRQQARRQQMMTEVEKYTGIFYGLILRNLQGEHKGNSCSVTVHLTLEGSIKYVVVNSGGKIICDATENAVYRVNKFPMSKDVDVNKELVEVKLTFAPVE